MKHFLSQPFTKESKSNLTSIAYNVLKAVVRGFARRKISASSKRRLLQLPQQMPIQALRRQKHQDSWTNLIQLCSPLFASVIHGNLFDQTVFFLDISDLWHMLCCLEPGTFDITIVRDYSLIFLYYTRYTIMNIIRICRCFQCWVSCWFHSSNWRFLRSRDKIAILRSRSHGNRCPGTYVTSLVVNFNSYMFGFVNLNYNLNINHIL